MPLVIPMPLVTLMSVVRHAYFGGLMEETGRAAASGERGFSHTAN